MVGSGAETVGWRQSTVRFSKILIKAKGPYGKWTRKSLAYRESKNVSSL